MGDSVKGTDMAASSPTGDEEATKSRVRRTCMSVSAFLFSRFGLCFLVVGYSIAGGFMFNAVESSNEQEDLQIIYQKRDQLVQSLINHTKASVVMIEDQWKVGARQLLNKFQADITEAVRQRGYAGRSSSTNGTEEEHMNSKGQWNIAAAVLYAVTVITSIGYGHITCKTSMGRALTMLYALVGIPLMLIFLAIVGSSFADAFRFIYSRICGAYNQMLNRRNANPSALNDGRTYKKYTSVPILVTMTLLFGYIMLGAVLFSKWEGWSYLDGAYFCFITLSTIGLGDLVPGRSLSTNPSSQNYRKAQAKLALCSLYLIVGLSLLVMCFNLVEEEVRAKFRRIAIILGIFENRQVQRVK